MQIQNSKSVVSDNTIVDLVRVLNQYSAAAYPTPIDGIFHKAARALPAVFFIDDKHCQIDGFVNVSFQAGGFARLLLNRHFDEATRDRFRAAGTKYQVRPATNGTGDPGTETFDYVRNEYARKYTAIINQQYDVKRQAEATIERYKYRQSLKLATLIALDNVEDNDDVIIGDDDLNSAIAEFVDDGPEFRSAIIDEAIRAGELRRTGGGDYIISGRVIHSVYNV